MNYKVGVSPTFKKKARRLVKKYASLKKEIDGLIALLEHDPEQGTPIGADVTKYDWRSSPKAAGSPAAHA